MVVHDDHGRAASLRELVFVADHLHEVNTADQSPGVAQERHDHGTTQQVLEAKPVAVDGGQRQLGGRVADPGRRQGHACAAGLSATMSA